MTTMACLVFLAFAQIVVGDVYMHNPKGSNNRLNEANAVRNNGDRLFDSQNNNRGGYNVGDKTDNAATQDASGEYTGAQMNQLYDFTALDDTKQYQMAYYEGSKLEVEWTNQHACGGNEQDDPNKVNCNIVIQYMCDTADVTKPSGGTDRAMTVALRNGGTTNDITEPNNYAETDPATDTDTDTGRHESKGWYYECRRRERNRGLLTLDQKLNGNDARYTRQNPNANRRGLECAEERDYFPYWVPTPWVDIAYLTDQMETPMKDESGQTVAEHVASGSQNVAASYKCNGLVENDQTTYINEEECTTNGGSWDTYAAKGTVAMDVEAAPWSRTNHLGNGRDGQFINYTWTLPSVSAGGTSMVSSDTQIYVSGSYRAAKCTLRLRYNISTDDYDPWNSTAADNYVVEQNPTVDIGTTPPQGLQLAINTNQYGRTFQDRSHTFYIMERPAGFGETVHNLNVRGKRGNIVQTFPSVEYDFVPNRLTINEGELIHLQWTGSNTHNNGGNGGDGQAGDDGQGTGGTDRNNFVSTMGEGTSYAIPLDVDMHDSYNIVKQSECWNLDGTAVASWQDCAVILATSGYGRTTGADFSDFSAQMNNAPASLIGGMVLRTNAGLYHYMSSRNHDFSNRGQKGWLKVE